MDGQTDGWTDACTDGRTDIDTYLASRDRNEACGEKLRKSNFPTVIEIKLFNSPATEMIGTGEICYATNLNTGVSLFGYFRWKG